MVLKHLRDRRRSGLTLLELILALSLSVLVLMSISMAINTHYRMLDVRRTNVEEAHLAHAALRHIADDLRSTVQYAPPDLSGLDAMSSNMSGALSTGLAAVSSGQLSGAALGGAAGLPSGSGLGGSGGTGSTQQSSGSQTTQGGQSGRGNTGAGDSGSGQGAGTGGSAGRSGTGQGAGSTALPASGQTGNAGATGEEAAPQTPTSTVKLFGSPSELRFDISRLPRVDQYQVLMTDDTFGATDIPSDVKTVVYFVRTEDSEFGLPEPAVDGIGKGLMRTEIDRAVSSWAEENGDTTSLYAGAKLLAKEVTGVTFQYWDGAEWATDWDSDQLGGLPLAVEISLTIQPTQAMSEEEIAKLASSDTGALPAERTYKLIVHLPTAISANTRTLETDAAETAAAEILPSEPSGTLTAGSSSSSGNGSGTGGQTGGGGGMGTGGGVGAGGFGSGGRGDRGGEDGRRRGDRNRDGQNPGPRPPGPGPGPTPPGPGPVQPGPGPVRPGPRP